MPRGPSDVGLTGDPAVDPERLGAATRLGGEPRQLARNLHGLGHTAYGGADLGAAITTAHRIKAGLAERWRAEWTTTAQRVEQEARAQLAAGHAVSGRDGLLRAATYYRSAEFFLRDADDDPRGRDLYERGRVCSVDAARLLDPAVEPVEIPFEGTTLNGYLCKGAGETEARATLIMCDGFDGWAEELHGITETSVAA